MHTPSVLIWRSPVLPNVHANVVFVHFAVYVSTQVNASSMTIVSLVRIFQRRSGRLIPFLVGKPFWYSRMSILISHFHSHAHTKRSFPKLSLQRSDFMMTMMRLMRNVESMLLLRLLMAEWFLDTANTDSLNRWVTVHTRECLASLPKT
jgi:hypothetical protein